MKARYVLLLFGLLISKLVFLQNVVNGNFDSLDSTRYLVFDSLTGKNETPYILVKPSNIGFIANAKLVNGDSLISCPSFPACVILKPFDISDGYFVYSYLALSLSHPLVEGENYRIGITVKEISAIGQMLSPADPWFGIKVAKDSIVGLDLWNGGNAPNIIDSVPGEVWYFPWQEAPDTAWTNLTHVLVANGGERYLFIGVIHHRAIHEMREISKLKKKARLWLRKDKRKHMLYIRNRFDLWTPTQISDSRLIGIIKSIGSSSFENPSYLIDNVFIRNLER